jgi:RimJ/RimL family protein N-acetyltransferase
VTSVPELQTARLVLEPVRASHAPEIWPQLDDERMWRYFPALRPATLEDLRRLYEKWERGSRLDDEMWLNWLCRERPQGVLVAAMQATVYMRERAAYLAYAVYPLHQRKGYAREAAQCVIAHVRERYGVERVFAEMDTRNEASFRLAESLGFTRVETRLAVERGLGSDADEYVYELRL